MTDTVTTHGPQHRAADRGSHCNEFIFKKVNKVS